MAVVVTDVKSAAETFIAAVAATSIAILVNVSTFTGFPLFQKFFELFKDVAILSIKITG